MSVETSDSFNMESLNMESLIMESPDYESESTDDDFTDVSSEDEDTEAYQESEMTRRQIDKRPEQELEQLRARNMQLEIQLTNANDKLREAKQAIEKKDAETMKFAAEANNLKLLVDEQNSRISFLENKQRKFEIELQILNEELCQERGVKERLIYGKELVLREKNIVEQSMNILQLEYKLKAETFSKLVEEFEELAFGKKTQKNTAQLAKGKHQLEHNENHEEDKFRDFPSQIKTLEQAKLQFERMRKGPAIEIQLKDLNLKEIRSNNYKRIKALECQLKNANEVRTELLKEREEYRRRYADVEDGYRSTVNTVRSIHELNSNLKKTGALLRDVNTTVKLGQRADSCKIIITQLKVQLADAERTRASAVKCCQAATVKAQENAACLEEILVLKSDLDDKFAAASRNCSQLQLQVQVYEGELSELSRKYRSAVTKYTMALATVKKQAMIISHLKAKKISLQELVTKQRFNGERMKAVYNQKHKLTFFMLHKVNRELKSRLEFEQAARSILESETASLKYKVEKLQEEVVRARSRENEAQEIIREIRITLKDSRNEKQALMSRGFAFNIKYRDLEIRLIRKLKRQPYKDVGLAIRGIEDELHLLEEDVVEIGDESN